MIDLKANPFNLDDEGVNWVNSTLNGLTLEEKVGQLFCLMGFTDDKNILTKLTNELGIGGIMYRPGPAKTVREAHKFLQDNSKVPMLLAANLEAGGNGLVSDGTNFAKPMQVGATNNPEMGYALGKVSCAEGAAVGCNWAFAPIVDIDMNFRNPITNLRTFGNNADLVIKMASGYLRAADEEGHAVSIKHFPGDGVDERDQHLLTSINDLSYDEWMETYGKVYSTLIDQGAKTVMVGHIALPNFIKSFNEKLEDPYTPATLSPTILNKLLREKLNFNGLIVTDATSMLGFTTAMPRSQAVPYSIAAGNDMFLFTKNLEEDVRFMFEGVKNGTITQERLDEAVTRILATKASLNLHIKQKEGTLVPSEEALSKIKCEQHIAYSKQCADEAITLVKDTQNLLPLSPAKHKRILINVLEEDDDMDTKSKIDFKTRLEKEGFEVTIRKRTKTVTFKNMARDNDADMNQLFAEMAASVEDFTKDYDLILYVANFETASNNTVIRIQWRGLLGFGNDFPWFTEEIPTMFISTANPYHLLDVPMIKTYINAYTHNEYTADAIVDKLMGRSEFKGVSPVDASCGRVDTMF